jgi:F0F1-type ATP synthase membrane subunit b/b'
MGSPFIGVDIQGVQAWQTQLNDAHEQVIAALNRYRMIAQQNNNVAHGQRFERINVECEDITNKHEADHNNLHAQYTKASNDLVQGIVDIAN